MKYAPPLAIRWKQVSGPATTARPCRRNIIQTFTCKYNGEQVFSAELFSAISANPYIAFFTTALESGSFVLNWEGDNGFTQTETVAITVTA